MNKAFEAHGEILRGIELQKGSNLGEVAVFLTDKALGLFYFQVIVVAHNATLFVNGKQIFHRAFAFPQALGNGGHR